MKRSALFIVFFAIIIALVSAPRPSFAEAKIKIIATSSGSGSASTPKKASDVTIPKKFRTKSFMADALTEATNDKPEIDALRQLKPLLRVTLDICREDLEAKKCVGLSEVIVGADPEHRERPTNEFTRKVVGQLLTSDHQLNYGILTFCKEGEQIRWGFLPTGPFTIDAVHERDYKEDMDGSPVGACYEE